MSANSGLRDGYWIMELDERNKKVLQAVIDSYIASGSPIGSNVLVKRYEFGVSSATLRNIMAELEEMGFLTHPHTSAGRVPTDRGYRYYIDSLISIERDTEDIEDQFRQAPEAPGLHGSDLQGLMEEASRFLATLSHCAGVVVAPVGARRQIQAYRVRPAARQAGPADLRDQHRDGAEQAHRARRDGSRSRI